jgi:hypothetical protein
MKETSSTINNMLAIALSILFSTLIAVFGAITGLIVAAFIVGTITGAWLMRQYGHGSDRPST